MAHPMMQENVWFDQWKVSEAEKIYHEKLAQSHSGLVVEDTRSPLVNEIAHARKQIQQALQNKGTGLVVGVGVDSALVSGRLDRLEKENAELRSVTDELRSAVTKMEARIAALEVGKTSAATPAVPSQPEASPVNEEDDDDDIDLFGSDADDEETERIKAENLKKYQEKKAKKPAVIAKSNVILDVKPWGDDTDMSKLETCVRSITMDGLLMGASELVPVGYGIKKLTISCVIEDEKVSVDELSDKIGNFKDYVQSVDVAAFNKI